MSTHGAAARKPGRPPAEPESLSHLRGDCARMAARWRRPEAAASVPPAAASEPGRPHGVHVPERSAHLLDGMSDYGD